MITNFPCVNCICLPVCRHKHYHDTVNDCALLNKVLDTYYEQIDNTSYTTIDIIGKHTGKFKTLLQSHLNPTRWKVDRYGIFVEGSPF